MRTASYQKASPFRNHRLFEEGNDLSVRVVDLSKKAAELLAFSVQIWNCLCCIRQIEPVARFDQSKCNAHLAANGARFGRGLAAGISHFSGDICRGIDRQCHDRGLALFIIGNRNRQHAGEPCRRLHHQSLVGRP